MLYTTMLVFGGRQLRGKAVHAAATVQMVASFSSDSKPSIQTLSKTSEDENESRRGDQARWWRPHPVTGVWIPEGYKGQIDAVELRDQTRVRTIPTASLDERAWWSSMEEVLDRDK